MSARATLLGEFKDWGRARHGWSERTVACYAERVRACLGFFLSRGRHITLATPTELGACLLGHSRTAATRNAYRCALVWFFQFLVETGRRTDDPAASLARVRVPRKIPRALAAEEIVGVVARADGMRAAVSAYVRILVYGGLRRDEARLLRWGMVRSDGYFHLTGKGSKERVVPIHSEIPQALTALNRSVGWLFPSPRDASRPVSRTAVAGWVRAAGEAAGIGGLHPHLLRSSCATRLFEQGVSEFVVQDWLGHANPATTRSYVQVRPLHLLRAARQLSYDQDGSESAPRPPLAAVPASEAEQMSLPVNLAAATEVAERRVIHLQSHRR